MFRFSCSTSAWSECYHGQVAPNENLSFLTSGPPFASLGTPLRGLFTCERSPPVVKSRSLEMMKRFAIAALVALFLSTLSDAQAPAVRVLASNGVRAVLQDLIPEAERAAGQPLAVEFGTSASIKRRIEANEPFDVTILASDVIDGLIKAGKLASDSRAEIARSGVG